MRHPKGLEIWYTMRALEANMPDLTDEIALFIRMLEFIGTFAGAISGCPGQK